MPFITSGKSKLFYEDHGNGPPLVLAHGVGGNHASWFNQVPTFSKSFRTITFDHRGFGKSEDVEGLGRSAFVEDLARLLDSLGLDKVGLVGQSMGGGTCAAFTCRWPERVAGLVHADSLAGVRLPSPFDADLEDLNNRTADLSQADRVLGLDFQNRDPERTFLYLQIAGFNSVSLKTLKGQPPRFAPADLAATGVPVLFVVGAQDAICSPQLIRVMHNSVPGSLYYEIMDAGHSGYFEQPKAFNDRVIAFFDVKKWH